MNMERFLAGFLTEEAALMPEFTPTELGLLLLLLSLPYLVILIRNTPASVMFLTFVLTTLLIICAVLTPGIPFWLHQILIPVCHPETTVPRPDRVLSYQIGAFIKITWNPG